MSNIDATLKERGSRYGEFPEHAFITQELKRAMHDNANWDDLADDQKEALDMVAHKIGRIINGDPSYIDSWTDIIGYTRLVEKRLIDEQEATKQFTFGFGQSINDEPNRCSVGEKLTGMGPDILRKTDKAVAQLEDDLRKFFGPGIEIVRVGS